MLVQPSVRTLIILYQETINGEERSDRTRVWCPVSESWFALNVEMWRLIRLVTCSCLLAPGHLSYCPPLSAPGQKMTKSGAWLGWFIAGRGQYCQMESDESWLSGRKITNPILIWPGSVARLPANWSWQSSPGQTLSYTNCCLCAQNGLGSDKCGKAWDDLCMIWLFSPDWCLTLH